MCPALTAGEVLGVPADSVLEGRDVVCQRRCSGPQRGRVAGQQRYSGRALPQGAGLGQGRRRSRGRETIVAMTHLHLKELTCKGVPVFIAANMPAFWYHQAAVVVIDLD